MNHFNALKPWYSFSRRLRPAAARRNSNQSQVLLLWSAAHGCSHTYFKTKVKQMTREEGRSQTGCCLSVGHRGIQLAKKQKGRETRSLRGFMAWCFPYVKPKMAITCRPPFIHSTLLIKAQFSHQLGRTSHLCLLQVTWTKNLSSNHVSPYYSKKQKTTLNYSLDGY